MKLSSSWGLSERTEVVQKNLIDDVNSTTGLTWSLCPASG